MSTIFHDLMAEQGFGALLDTHGETIQYRGVNESKTGAWKEIIAIVEEDSPENALALGISAPGQQPVIVLVIDKTQLSCVTVKRDEVCVRETIYGVKQILREDPAGWRLYCAA